jgi:hypothetical protein
LFCIPRLNLKSIFVTCQALGFSMRRDVD